MRFFYLILLFAPLLMGSPGIKGQTVNKVSKIFEYVPAPGQFVNTSIGQPHAAKNIVGDEAGAVTLGGFGGYIVAGFDKPVLNHADNPFGVDFTIYSNATEQSIEPAVVYVMKDDNKNGLPDDTWYMLAGSDYWFATTQKNYSITYENPGGVEAKDVPWTDNLGNTGVIPANEFHVQPYYPLPDSFPEIDEARYTMQGCKIKARLDMQNPGYVKSKRYAFGFADNTKTINAVDNWLPDNPYTIRIEGRGGDAFDISWAINENDDFIELDEINFIKIQNATNEIAGWLGELSTEIVQVVDVEPGEASDEPYQCIAIEPINKVELGDELTLNSYYFEWGKPLDESIIWESSDDDVGDITPQGILSANNVGQCTIYAKYAADENIYDSVLIQVQEPVQVSSKLNHKMGVYPNPATDFLFIKGVEGNVEYSIYETTGRSVQNGIYKQGIHVSGYHPGIYLIKLQSETVRITQIFMVQ